MASKSSVLWGTYMLFHVKMKLEAIPQCINQCDWGLKMHETNWWAGESCMPVCMCAWVCVRVSVCVVRVVGVEGVCITFFQSLGSAEMQYNSLAELPCMKLLSTDLDHLSCYLPHPCFSISENSTLCFQWGAAFMYKIREKLLIKKHTLNNYAQENFSCHGL